MDWIIAVFLSLWKSILIWRVLDPHPQSNFGWTTITDLVELSHIKMKMASRPKLGSSLALALAVQGSYPTPSQERASVGLGFLCGEGLPLIIERWS